jgi:hypothetical protein
LGFHDPPAHEERPAPSLWQRARLSDIEEEEDDEEECDESIMMPPPTAAELAALKQQVRHLEWKKNMAKLAEKRQRRTAKQAMSTAGAAAGQPDVSSLSYDEQAAEDSVQSENGRRGGGPCDTGRVTSATATQPARAGSALWPRRLD